LRYIWGDEIEDVLRSVNGKKILFAFSNPAAAAADAIVRTEAKDILALVTDSGPFVQMARCSWNLLHVHYKVKLFPFGVPATAGLAALWGLTHSKDLQSDLLKLPANFPVLSIRGWEDPLVPVTAIDEAYAPAKNHLHYETLALPKGGHLNGLKDFPDEYKDKVSRFLIKVCSR
jgi:pimeloyl-ACP methyl ester carboxylesterase